MEILNEHIIDFYCSSPVAFEGTISFHLSRICSEVFSEHRVEEATLFIPDILSDLSSSGSNFSRVHFGEVKKNLRLVNIF